MLVTHFGRMGVALSAMIVVAACGGGDSASDSANADSGAVSSAGGDVAGSNMTSPTMVMGFLTTVNQGEIEAGQLAQTKATNAQVKQYAQMLVTEHRRADSMTHGGMSGGTAGAAGTTGAAGTGTTGGTTAGAAGTTAGTAGSTGAGAAGAGGQAAADLQQKHQQAMQTLQSQPKGRAWDSTFVALMITEHQDVLSRLESMRGTGGSASGGTAGGTTGAAGTTGGAAGTTGGATGTGNQSAVGSTGTTQSAGQVNQGDQVQTQLQSAIEMVRKHIERGQEVQRALQGGSR